ncbi:class I SAM-dependent methyltransferase [Bacillus sp. JCM 19041]|uniref:class I SAM-dependent methyltransferase n=1 Tax=Bacillus sp. JCM 19041 TaxID=1460637 RepID=UPI00336A5620
MTNKVLNNEFLTEIERKPKPFEQGEPLFWNDPHISKQMLANHLNPEVDGATRNATEVENVTNWLQETLQVKQGSKILDIGCGPGLYATQFAEVGAEVTGIDYSKRSIEFAKEQARHKKQSITYVYGDYTEVDFADGYDAAILIYGDYCVLPLEKRKLLLNKVYDALAPGGFFAFDVSTPSLRKKAGLTRNWYAHNGDGGFWKPSSHLVLEQGFQYKEDLSLDQFSVIDENGEVSIYRNWFQDFTRERITEELLTQSDFQVNGVYNDLKGTLYEVGGDWIGLICQK